jgi:outer membrane immunogenic protein
MGNRNIGFTFLAAPAFAFRTESIRQDVDLVTARINYRWGGLIVGRY